MVIECYTHRKTHYGNTDPHTYTIQIIRLIPSMHKYIHNHTHINGFKNRYYMLNVEQVSCISVQNLCNCTLNKLIFEFCTLRVY